MAKKLIYALVLCAVMAIASLVAIWNIPAADIFFMYPQINGVKFVSVNTRQLHDNSLLTVLELSPPIHNIGSAAPQWRLCAKLNPYIKNASNVIPGLEIPEPSLMIWKAYPSTNTWDLLIKNGEKILWMWHSVDFQGFPNHRMQPVCDAWADEAAKAAE